MCEELGVLEKHSVMGHWFPYLSAVVEVLQMAKPLSLLLGYCPMTCYSTVVP